MDIYSGGMPTPKAPQSPAHQPIQSSPFKKVDPSSPVIVYKEAPQKPQSPMKEPTQVQEISPEKQPTVVIEVADDSSKFSSESENNKPQDQKELLRQKLALLKEKLKKAKTIEEKQQMLEKERDKELRQKEIIRKKAEQKANQKQRDIDRKSHTQTQERESRKPAPVKQSQPKSTPVKKAQPTKPASQKPLDANATEDQIDFNNKLHLVDELAKRWWYALPQWPPQDFDYQPDLDKRGLELVESSKLKEQSKLKRVCKVEAYAGVFRDADQKLHDLRPQESMPSLQNFQRKTVNDLQILLKTAYEEQQRVVQEMLDGKVPSYDRETEVEICQSLGKKLKKIGKYA